MADFMAAMGKKMLESKMAEKMMGAGDDVMKLKDGQFGPMMGKLAGGQTMGLINMVGGGTPTAPGSDPYKPEQPLAYDDKGGLMPPTPPSNGLINFLASGSGKDRTPDMELSSAGMPAPVITQMTNPNRMKQSSLARQAYGNYL